jgi:hypothetical protein
VLLLRAPQRHACTCSSRAGIRTNSSHERDGPGGGGTWGEEKEEEEEEEAAAAAAAMRREKAVEAWIWRHTRARTLEGATMQRSRSSLVLQLAFGGGGCRAGLGAGLGYGAGMECVAWTCRCHAAQILSCASVAA